MLKVIELIPTLGTGGAETMVKDYCLLFNKKEIDVHVVVIDHRLGTYNEQVLDENGIKVTYLSELVYGNRYELNVFQKLVRKLSRYYYWRKLVLAENPDVIHLHLHLDRYMKCLPLKRLKCKLIMTIHNVIDNYYTKDKRDREKYREYRETNRLIHTHGMKLVTLHNGLAEELCQFFDTENVVTINNGVILDRFNPKLYDRNEIRSKLGYTTTDFVIGNVASMTQQKNHELILSVFEYISKKQSNARLLLIGSGPQKHYVENYIKDNNLQEKVTILSNRGDIPELMSAMDVFFFPSKWEGFGNVMIEAQSMGLKCVVSDAVPEATRVTDKVYECELDDSIDAWTEALLTDIHKPVDRVNNIEDYDMKNCVRRLEEVYVSL